MVSQSITTRENALTLEELVNEIVKAQNNADLQLGLERSITNFSNAVNNILSRFSDLAQIADYVKKVKEETLNNLDYYIGKAMESINATRAHSHFASNRESVLKIIDGIIGGERKTIVKGKSMVTEEIMLREYLAEKGHEVYETDLGEFLLQLSREKPMHTIVPALHLSKEQVAKLLSSFLGCSISENATHEELVLRVREFLREKFVNADVGISGANAVAADTGTVFIVHNEGNIGHVATLPPVHIVIASVDKIVPTFRDALLQVMVQSGYAGLYPPTYLNIISGPSSTADIEYHRVYGVHGVRDLHVIFYEGGRIKALKDPTLREQLRCVKCGRCQVSCPIWDFCGNFWGGKVYGGPMGVGWTAITEGVEKAQTLSWLCIFCGACKEVCPVEVNSAEISRQLRTKSMENGFAPSSTKKMLENVYKYGNPFGLPSSKRGEWTGGKVPEYRPGVEFLYYVGDMGSYHPRAQSVAWTLAKILSSAKVSFGILGANENCSGSEAYELGEEGLFEEMARRNIALFDKLEVKNVVTLSPHSYNVMKNFYGNYGGKYNVKHHAQLLWELIKNGQLQLPQNVELNKTITYHDPCFLCRWNNEHEAPRNILNAIPGAKFIEMKRNKKSAHCCGGGSGNAYTGLGCGLIPESKNTPSRSRVREAYELGAEILSVACPLCLVMLEDAVKSEGLEDKLLVKDIAEIIYQALAIELS